MKKLLLIVLLLSLLLTTLYAEENDNALGFSAMKTKYISVDINIELPIYFSGYTSNDEFTYRTAVFYDSIAQQADFEAYYLDNNQNKVFAEIVSENGNKYAVFKIKPITREEYIFYVSGTIISENKIVLTNSTGNLNDVPEDTKEYIKATRFIQSDSSEIRTVSNFIKESEDPLENLVAITNWVHSYVTYDFDYVEVVNDSKKVLADRKGVCDEFAILEAAILRAQGYPVKYVVGYANTSQEWGPHAWLEVYVPGQEWIPVDPTYNEVGFVDSSHIVLEKLKDPVESKDSVSSTNKVSVVFGEKIQDFKHNQTKNFEEYGYGNVINMDVIASKDALMESPYIVKLKLQNTTSNPVVILVVSQLAEDFVQLFPESRKTTYYIKPFDSKVVDYYFLLPKLDNSYIYGFAFSSQFNGVE
ncbi:MAG: transglutaminase-like domain-containing protein [archaeon]|jgi:transglutaminase-like putative cysteine protease